MLLRPSLASTRVSSASFTLLVATTLLACGTTGDPFAPADAASARDSATASDTALVPSDAPISAPDASPDALVLPPDAPFDAPVEIPDSALDASISLPDAMAPDASAVPDAHVSPDADTGVTPPADAATSTTACTTVTRTCAQVTAAFAASNAGVVVACDAAAGTFTFHSTGVPNYTSAQRTPNAIEDQGWIVQLPLNPTCAISTTAVSDRGEIGFMVNGVPFYGPQDMNGNDAVVNEGVSFDDCEGHADPGCSYHYHEEPVCVFGIHDTSAAHRETDGHPALIGYGLDGFGLYASDHRAGIVLDACNGHSDATHGYHYHATTGSPYLLGCYHGAVNGRVMRTLNLCNGHGMPNDAGTTTTTDAAPPASDAATMTGPTSCTQSSQCTGHCPAGSAGCTCHTTSMGMQCVPTCSNTSACPPGPMGQTVTCNGGVCLPPM